MATRFGRARGCHRRFWQLDFRLFLAILVFLTSLKLLELVHRGWNCNHLSSYSQYSTWFLNLAILAERHPEIHRWRSQPTLLRRYRPLERWLFFIIQRKKAYFCQVPSFWELVRFRFLPNRRRPFHIDFSSSDLLNFCDTEREAQFVKNKRERDRWREMERKILRKRKLVRVVAISVRAVWRVWSKRESRAHCCALLRATGSFSLLLSQKLCWKLIEWIQDVPECSR